MSSDSGSRVFLLIGVLTWRSCVACASLQHPQRLRNVHFCKEPKHHLLRQQFIANVKTTPMVSIESKTSQPNSERDDSGFENLSVFHTRTKTLEQGTYIAVILNQREAIITCSYQFYQMSCSKLSDERKVGLFAELQVHKRCSPTFPTLQNTKVTKLNDFHQACGITKTMGGVR